MVGEKAGAAMFMSGKIDFKLKMINFINEKSFPGSDPKLTHLSLSLCRVSGIFWKGRKQILGEKNGGQKSI